MRARDLATLGTLTILVCVLFSTANVTAGKEFASLDNQVHGLDFSKAVPGQLNYQGFLVNAADSSAVTATLEMTFRLFDSETKGVELWSETQSAVEVNNGLFHVLLGSATSFPDGLFDGSTPWLQTEVGPEILEPRKPLVSVAYSHRTNSAEMLEDNTLSDLDDRWVNEGDLDHLDAADGDPTNAVYVNDAGKVGVGTTSPLTELDVDGSVNATTYYGDGSNLTGISGMADADWTIDGNNVYHETGSVGIGTTSPSHPLDVNGAIGATTYYGDGSNLTGISGTTDDDWTIDGADVYHETGNVGIGTVTPTAPLTIQTISGTDVQFSSGGSNADIVAPVQFNIGTSGIQSLHLLSSSLARMCVTGTGNVGIGTTNPQRLLHLVGTNPRVLIEASSSSPEVNFTNSDDAGPETWALYKHGTTDDFRFYQNGDKVTIKNSTGYVGIGTASPISQLHIKESSFPTYLTIESETGYAPGINFNVNGTNEWSLYYHPIDAKLGFYREGVGEKMVIENNGDVGVGISDPTHTLHVVDTTPNSDHPAIYGEHAVQDWWGVGVKGVGLFKGVEGIVNATGGEDYYGVYGEASSTGGGADVYGVYGKVTAGSTESYGVYGTSNDGAAICGNRMGRSSFGWVGSWYRGVYGKNDNVGSAGAEGQSDYGHAIHGYSPYGYAGYFSGDVHITGTLTGGKGSSTIDHPLDPENKLLRNNYVESPECLLIYRGKTRLDDSGRAVIELPDYFTSLADEDAATVHLTPIGRSRSSQRYELCYEWQPGHMDFAIYGEPMREISWMVTAERDDPVSRQLAQPVEEEKGSHSKVCDRGELLYPKAYGRPEAAGKDYKRREEIALLEKEPPKASHKADKQ